MAAITTRQTAGTGATVKGSPLTNAEVDNNFINLNTDVSLLNDLKLVISDTAPSNPTDNVLWWKSDEGQLYLRFNDGTSIQWVQAAVGLKGDPGPSLFATTIIDPVNNTKFPLFRATTAMTLSSVSYVVAGTSPSVSVSLRYNADFSASGVECITNGTTVNNTTTGQKITSFDNASIAADDWLWVVLTSVSNVTTLCVNLTFN